MSVDMAVTPTNARPSKRQRTSDASIGALQCQVCHRAYERADHLNRHLDSHRNERSFQCEECPAAFNRRDLLLRHQATHTKNAKDGLVGPNRVAERATKACNSCVLSKVKCDNGRPCKRCQKKGLSCVTRFSDTSSFTQSTTSEQPPQVFATPADDQGNPNGFDDDMQLNGVYLNEASTEAQALLDLYNTNSYTQHTIPAFFEQIMVPAPDFMGVDYMQAPPDLTAWMPETDWLGQVDIFGNDFTPTVSQMLEAPVSQVIALPPATPPANTDVSLEKIDSDSARRRHAVFKQSAWHCGVPAGLITSAIPQLHHLPGIATRNYRQNGSDGWSKNHTRGTTNESHPVCSVSNPDRLVYHLFEHDIHMTMAKHRPPLITYAELTLILPASKTLWLAPSAEMWRIRYLEMDIVASRPSLQTLLKDEAAILCLPVDIDAQVARSSYLHGIAAQIWEYAQQSALMHESSDPSSQLWARSRQEKLYHYLQREDLLPGNSPAVTCLFHQFLQMYLHVNLDLITRFAGKCGESAANSAYTHLSPWSQTKEARIAICHAGQVVRAARHIPPYQIRGPDSFMLYHAIMVLWTYSMMMRDRAKKTGTTTPMRAQPSSFLSKVIYLDDAASENQTSINSFVLMNSGIPCLRIISTHQPVASESGVADRPEICNLKYPSQVMKVGVRLLDTTHPDVDRETGPPLVRALCGLMEELGGLR
ncbi:hypothetical protein IG631_18878 [Alternaria alternata]|nr:hypothetical protein IG631_18878 [Alternaria alternata]